MLKLIKDILHQFSEDARKQQEREEMNRYLSEATDLFHLEKLEREWFRYHRR